jgi:hypothetical protein
MLGLGYRVQLSAGFVLAAALAAQAMLVDVPSVEAMKARVRAISVGDRPHLCVQIAERQLAEADKLYSTADVEQAQTRLTDVVAYSELARDYSIQSHKYQKQTEITVRVMARKLTEVMHALAHDKQEPVGKPSTGCNACAMICWRPFSRKARNEGLSNCRASGSCRMLDGVAGAGPAPSRSAHAAGD